MVMNYAIIPEAYFNSDNRASVKADPKDYVIGAIGPKVDSDATSKDEWAQFDILVDGAHFGFGLAASALIAFTLY